MKRRDQKKVGNCVLAERAPRVARGFSKALKRLAEVDRLIACRYGQFLPPEQLDAFLTVALPCLKDARGWLARYSPYADLDAALEPIRRANEWRRYNLNVEEAGAMLVLMFEERQLLGIVTMWASDMPVTDQKAAVYKARRERDRVRIAEKRKIKRKARGDWIAERSIEKERPWEALGISRRAWYYRQKKQNCTDVSRPAQADCTDVSRTEETFGFRYVVGDQPVQCPSIEPTTADVTSMTSNVFPMRRKAGRQRPADPKQLTFVFGDTE